MNSPDRITPGGRGLLALAALAILAAGCLSTHPTFTARGTGNGTSSSFQAAAGAYGISWTAVDKAEPADGCLFGLLLDPVELAPTEDAGATAGDSPPKLAYQVLDAGGLLHGRTTLDLRAGTYQFVVEGSCTWNLGIDGPAP